jgi:hypothetical protein
LERFANGEVEIFLELPKPRRKLPWPKKFSAKKEQLNQDELALPYRFIGGNLKNLLEICFLRYIRIYTHSSIRDGRLSQL